MDATTKAIADQIPTELSTQRAEIATQIAGLTLKNKINYVQVDIVTDNLEPLRDKQLLIEVGEDIHNIVGEKLIKAPRKIEVNIRFYSSAAKP